MDIKRLHRGWVIALIGALILVTNGMTIYSFGVFFKPLISEFQWERGALSGAYSLYSIVVGLLSMLTGRLNDKYGPRALLTIGGLLSATGFILMSQANSLWQVYLVWGLLMGPGGACNYVPVTSTIPRWFNRKVGIATGIAVTGMGIGGVIAPLLIQWLISIYSWRQASIIHGLIILTVAIPLAQFMRRSAHHSGFKPYGDDGIVEVKTYAVAGKLLLRQVIGSKPFWMVGLAMFCIFFSARMAMVHIVPHAIDIGISEAAAVSILSVIGGMSVVGRLSVAYLSDRFGARVMLVTCAIISTVSLIWLVAARESWMLFVFAVLMGLAYGGIMPLQSIAAAELFGLSTLGTIVGAFVLMTMAGGALGPPLAGSIFDITRDYTPAFLISATLGIIAIILGVMLVRYKTRKATT